MSAHSSMSDFSIISDFESEAFRSESSASDVSADLVAYRSGLNSPAQSEHGWSATMSRWDAYSTEVAPSESEADRPKSAALWDVNRSPSPAGSVALDAAHLESEREERPESCASSDDDDDDCIIIARKPSGVTSFIIDFSDPYEDDDDDDEQLNADLWGVYATDLPKHDPVESSRPASVALWDIEEPARPASVALWDIEEHLNLKPTDQSAEIKELQERNSVLMKNLMELKEVMRFNQKIISNLVRHQPSPELPTEQRVVQASEANPIETEIVGEWKLLSTSNSHEYLSALHKNGGDGLDAALFSLGRPCFEMCESGAFTSYVHYENQSFEKYTGRLGESFERNGCIRKSYVEDNRLVIVHRREVDGEVLFEQARETMHIEDGKLHIKTTRFGVSCSRTYEKMVSSGENDQGDLLITEKNHAILVGEWRVLDMHCSTELEPMVRTSLAQGFDAFRHGNRLYALKDDNALSEKVVLNNKTFECVRHEPRTKMTRLIRDGLLHEKLVNESGSITVVYERV
ncbi:unnamed protein product [Caenorhabditis sp. 36 PRJEB53466]|nr:unnamed protein product [Caenorhabditis sp. 36 PRJEB53466]